MLCVVASLGLSACQTTTDSSTPTSFSSTFQGPAIQTFLDGCIAAGFATDEPSADARRARIHEIADNHGVVYSYRNSVTSSRSVTPVLDYHQPTEGGFDIREGQKWYWGCSVRARGNFLDQASKEALNNLKSKGFRQVGAISRTPNQVSGFFELGAQRFELQMFQSPPGRKSGPIRTVATTGMRLTARAK